MARKDLLTRLADAGEDAISKLGESPGMDRMLGFANSTRDRLDELTRRVRGIDELEQRLERIEKRLDELSGTKGAGGSSRSGSRAKPSTSGSKSGSTARKTPSSKGSSGKTGGSSPG